MEMRRWIAGAALVLGLMPSTVMAGSRTGPAQPTGQDAAGRHAPTPPDAAALLVGAMRGRRLVLLGEMHGTAEIPRLVEQVLQRLAKDGESTLLALEIARQDQPVFDAYLASRGDAAARTRLLAAHHWQDSSHDGRDSKAMLELVEAVRVLRQSGARISLVLVDDLEGFKPGGDRDALMAQHLRAAWNHIPEARVLLLAGNMHASVRRPKDRLLDQHGNPIEPRKSAGRHLADLVPWAVRIDGAQGSAWFCSHEGCGAHLLLDHGAPASASLDPMAANEAWDARLLLPRLSASSPATFDVGIRE